MSLQYTRTIPYYIPEDFRQIHYNGQSASGAFGTIIGYTVPDGCEAFIDHVGMNYWNANPFNEWIRLSMWNPNGTAKSNILQGFCPALGTSNHSAPFYGYLYMKEGEWLQANKWNALDTMWFHVHGWEREKN